MPDIVAGTANNTAVALNGIDGSELWEFTMSGEGGGDVWRVEYIDSVDGDAVPDVVIGTATDRVLCVPGDPDSHGEHKKADKHDEGHEDNGSLLHSLLRTLSHRGP